MTFKITIRGTGCQPIAAEYLCPVHGRFTIIAERDVAGDPPSSTECQVLNTLREAVVPPRGNPGAPCGRVAPFVISAPRGKVRIAEVVRGGYERPARETWTNTENLGEGQELEDWQADREKVWEREREREVMEMSREL